LPEAETGSDDVAREWAALKQEWSSEKTLTRRQVIVAAVLGAALLAGFIVKPVLAASALVGFFVVVFLITAAYRCAYFLTATRSREQPRPTSPRPGTLPLYSILVPLYREANVVRQLVDALTRIDYPQDRLEVLFLVEQDDPETREALEEGLPEGWRIIVVPPGKPRTKPRALNVGLPHVRGELFTIYDAEDRPDPDQLLKAVAAFEHLPDEVACLQARLDFYNSHQNHLTKWFTCEYATHFGLTLKGMARHRHPLPLGGTSTHFRTSVVRMLGGWDAWNVTEDCELGMRLAAAGFEVDMLDSITWEEALPVLRRWFRQRSHWIKGYLLTGLVLLRTPLRTGRAMGWGRFAASLANVGGTGLVLLFWPLFWLLLWIYIGLRLGGVDVTPIEAAFPGPILALGITSLLLGNFVVLLAHVSAVYNLGRYDLVRYAITIPFYWAFSTVGGWIGATQLVSRPHFWAKTTHGLAGETVEEPPPSAVEVPSTAPESPADRWLLLSQALTAAGLAAAAIVTVRADLIFGYSDSAPHVVIPRRVFDNAEPGFEQLGTHWTPLFHALQLPFVWFDPLYTSGASGVIVSAVASLVTSLFLYKLVILVGGSRLQGLAVAAILVASPSFLYSGVIPMLPATMMATATANVYFLTKWALTRRGWDLLLAGLTLTLATLSHYDAWILLALEPAVVFVIARRSWRSAARTEASLLLWGLAGVYGIGLFFVMNVMIYGRPLAFLDRYRGGAGGAAAADDPSFTATQLSPMADYPLAAWLNAGPVLVVVAAVGAVFFLWASRGNTRRLVSLLLFYPFLFYATIAFVGIDFIGADPTLGHWVNLRYGTPILPAFAFLAVAGFRNRILLGAAVLAVAVGAVLMIRSDRVAAWEDGRYDVPTDSAVRDAARWVGERSAGSRILIPIHHDLVDRFELRSGRPSSAFIDANDTRTWLKVVTNPATMSEEGVEWIVWIGEREEQNMRAFLAASGARPCYAVRTEELELPALRIFAVGRGCGT
jgi:cellulose synthase/poly-beta-1,6-N-acetylglucosamine synthase-like glycosyltransferase